jgi:hypothetical protein
MSKFWRKSILQSQCKTAEKECQISRTAKSVENGRKKTYYAREGQNFANTEAND